MNARVALQVARRGKEVVVVLSLLAVVLFAAAGYVYATPPVEAGTTTAVDRQAFRVSMTDSIVVTKDTQLYTSGHTLTGREAYFVQASETLRLHGRIEVPADQNVSVTYRFALNATATRNDQVVWQMEDVFADETRHVENGSIQENASLDVGRLSDRLARVERVVEPTATVEVRLVLVATYESDSTAGDPYRGTVRLTREFVMIDNAYWVEGKQTAVETEETVVERPAAPGDPDYVSVAMLGGGGLVAIVAAMWLDVLSRRLPSVAVLRHRANRQSYEEWISTGQFVYPEWSVFIELDSLDDIVNTAIDAGQRVIHDEEFGVYSVYSWPYVFVFFDHRVDRGDGSPPTGTDDGDDTADS